MEEIADEQEMKQGVHMDNFIDKFAQRRNAQDMIRANAMAEAEEHGIMDCAERKGSISVS